MSTKQKSMVSFIRLKYCWSHKTDFFLVNLPKILTLVLCVLQYKGAHVKPGFAEHFYSNPGRYKGRENMLVSYLCVAQLI